MSSRASTARTAASSSSAARAASAVPARPTRSGQQRGGDREGPDLRRGKSAASSAGGKRPPRAKRAGASSSALTSPKSPKSPLAPAFTGARSLAGGRSEWPPTEMPNPTSRSALELCLDAPGRADTASGVSTVELEGPAGPPALDLGGLRAPDVVQTQTVYEETSAGSRSAGSDEGERHVAVTLTRRAGQAWVPWGLRFDAQTLALVALAKGSVAAESGELIACAGMQLVSVNDVAVRSHKEVKDAIGGQARGAGDAHVVLRFRDTGAT